MSFMSRVDFAVVNHADPGALNRKSTLIAPIHETFENGQLLSGLSVISYEPRPLYILAVRVWPVRVPEPMRPPRRWPALPHVRQEMMMLKTLAIPPGTAVSSLLGEGGLVRRLTDDGHADGGDAVDNSHEDVADGAEDTRDLWGRLAMVEEHAAGRNIHKIRRHPC
jgi:hypothetical protein